MGSGTDREERHARGVPTITGASQGLGHALAEALAGRAGGRRRRRDEVALTAAASLPGEGHRGAPAMSPTPPTAGTRRGGRATGRRRSPGQQREHARREPAPGVRRPGAPDLPAPAGRQRGRTARPGARALPQCRRQRCSTSARRRRGGLRDVRVRILEGRPRPREPGARRGAGTCACTPSTPATCAPRCTRPRSARTSPTRLPATVAPGCSTCCTPAGRRAATGRIGGTEVAT